MGRQIKWTSRAYSNLSNVISYLSESWPEEISTNFLDTLDEHIEIIKERPEAYPFVNKLRGIHRCVITEHNSLFYQVKEDTIEVLSLFDTRQDPSKLKI